MSTVLITTDFSAPSRHALDYACLLLRNKDISLDLLHIFEIPVGYTTDGMALAAIGDATGRAEERMQDELERIRAAYPGISIAGRVITGSFLETLRQEAKLTGAPFIVLGTAGFTDLYLGDDDPLNALRTIPAPVLFIPHGVPLKPIRNIAYASNYASAGPQIPVRDIMDWIGLMDANLQVVHTDPNPYGTDVQQMVGENWLKKHLAPLMPAFHWIRDTDVIHGLSGFIASNNIDCVLVVPRKYGIWQSLFHQSRTKALARLNKIPVIAFHSNEE